MCQPGHGRPMSLTTLTLTKPLDRANLPIGSKQSIRGESMRILLVEGEVQTGQYLRRALVENGFAVDVMRFDSGGFHPPHRAEYDLLVCDVPRGAGPISETRWSSQD